MIGKRQAKREALRVSLMEAAKGRIEKNGLTGLRARDIARDAGCALGGLYNVFENLDDLILHINTGTIARLDTNLRQAINNLEKPQDILVALCRAYLAFAIDNRNLWSALFDHKLPENFPTPEWKLNKNTQLFAHIVEPLSALKPGLSDAQLQIEARIVFSAVHGIISISLEEGFIAVPRDTLEEQLVEFVKTLVYGIEHAPI